MLLLMPVGVTGLRLEMRSKSGSTSVLEKKLEWGYLPVTAWESTWE